MSKIFISYRRDDSQWQTKSVYEALAKVVDDPKVDIFYDLDSMTVGLNFKQQIDMTVAQCDMVLAMIGRNWLNAADPDTGKRRLDDPRDFVRAEIAAALKRDIPVVPVLLDGVAVPEADELPEDIRELSMRHGVKLRADSFDNDVGVLIRGLNIGQQVPADKPSRSPGADTKASPGGVVAAVVALLLVSLGGGLWTFDPFGWRDTTTSAPTATAAGETVAGLDPALISDLTSDISAVRRRAREKIAENINGDEDESAILEFVEWGVESQVYYEQLGVANVVSRLDTPISSRSSERAAMLLQQLDRQTTDQTLKDNIDKALETLNRLSSTSQTSTTALGTEELAASADAPAARASAIRRVQTALKRLGLYTSSVDGAAGRGTIAAAASFASDAGLTAPDLATGALDDIAAFADRAERAAREFEISENAAWMVAERTDTVRAIESFLSDYPNGPNAARARTRLAALKAEAEAAAAKQRAQAAREAEAQAWALAQRTDTKAGYERYLASHASGANAAAARAKLKAIERPSTPGQVFRDALSGGGQGPEMVVIPSGRFVMGSPSSEEGRDDDEGPVRTVRIDYQFAVGKYEVTWAEWGACVADGTCDDAGPASTGGDEGWGRGSRPVINVDWNDAQAYAGWLSRKTGKTYRLLSEAEWEYAARAGTTSAYPWGNDRNGGCAYSNAADITAKREDSNWTTSTCDDGVGKKTALVGRYQANAFGLHDMIGNVWEWTQDCWNASYSGGPSNGSAWTIGECSRRVLRGGSWSHIPQSLRSANRLRGTTADRGSLVGFRVARTL
ncbi:MAG: SUMF1/EgtB/PvdO family nonheme iron enzyme [Pseudomonadota bacterium]